MKTTAKHFALFKAECRKWLDRFGLKGWRVEFFHDDHADISNARAWYQVNSIVDRCASIGLTSEWQPDSITNEKIKVSAFHEACELFLVRLRVLAGARFIDESEIDEECHAIIRTLENVFFEAR